jgi:hypothetical protein
MPTPLLVPLVTTLIAGFLGGGVGVGVAVGVMGTTPALHLVRWENVPASVMVGAAVGLTLGAAVSIPVGVSLVLAKRGRVWIRSTAAGITGTAFAVISCVAVSGTADSQPFTIFVLLGIIVGVAIAGLVAGVEGWKRSAVAN